MHLKHSDLASVQGLRVGRGSGSEEGSRKQGERGRLLRGVPGER